MLVCKVTLILKLFLGKLGLGLGPYIVEIHACLQGNLNINVISRYKRYCRRLKSTKKTFQRLTKRKRKVSNSIV